MSVCRLWRKELSVWTVTRWRQRCGGETMQGSLSATPVGSTTNCTRYFVYCAVLLSVCTPLTEIHAVPQVNRPLSMKKDGIQTRNRKVTIRKKSRRDKQLEAGQSGPLDPTKMAIYPSLSQLLPRHTSSPSSMQLTLLCWLPLVLLRLWGTMIQCFSQWNSSASPPPVSLWFINVFHFGFL